MCDLSKPSSEDLREYLFDMLSQLAKMATACNEPGVSLVLQTMVATRNVSPKLRSSNGKVEVAQRRDE